MSGPFQFDESDSRPPKPQSPKKVPATSKKPLAESTFIGLGILLFGLTVAARNGHEYLRNEGRAVPLAEFEKAQSEHNERGLYALGGLVLLGVGGAILAYKAPSDTLTLRVSKLGDVRGKTRKEIGKIIGKPSVRDYGPDETETATWITEYYSITLAFKDGICTGVVREVDGRA